ETTIINKLPANNMPKTQSNDFLKPSETDVDIQLNAFGPRGIPTNIQIPTKVIHASKVIYFTYNNLTLGSPRKF
ncbi:MAG: hypothetical protein ACI9ES_001019, partial [Oceanospirillaceae bacterium]